jgi:transcriptional regulator with XRE-family HTH domain
MSFGGGYLTGRELSIWKLRRDGLRQADIARRLGVKRQGINRTLLSIDSKVGQALTEAATLNKLDVWGVDLGNGIMEAYSQAHQVLAIVSFSEANGVQVWYLYEGNCSACNRVGACSSMLIAEAEERGMELSEEDLKAEPTELARRIFSKFTKIADLR